MRIKTFIFCLVFACSALSASERHIGLLVKTEYKGELAFAYRIQFACKNIGWKADVIDIRKPVELKKNKYDFVINLVPGWYQHPKCKNYLAIFDPVHHYFNKRGELSKRYRSYDGYLLTYSPTTFGNEKNFGDHLKFPYMLWYPTVQRQECKTTDPSHLFYICCSWGNRFEDEKFQLCMSLLDKESYTRFYGSSQFQSYYPFSYQGSIPYNDESLFQVAAEAGVTLVLHSSYHNTFGLPSGRIFEAAAASTVIISDQNAFVREHFGDSVLYINTEEDGISIYSQIQNHMNWIRANKFEALEKAKKANAIYKEKFLLEDQLLRLEEFHIRLSSRPKNLVFAWLQAIGSSDL